MKNSKAHFGFKKFLDLETDEEIEVPVIEEEIEQGDINFEKIWIAHVLSALNELGNRKIKILSYLFQKREKSNNAVIKTNREIAKEINVSYTTVAQTLRKLEDAKLITRKIGVIYLNPKMIFKGTHQNRMRVLHEYRTVQNLSNSTNVSEFPPTDESKPQKNKKVA